MSSTNSQTRTSLSPDFYDSDYYRSSNYADYLERADRYKKTATEIVDILRKLHLLEHHRTIIDYGCAVGFLLEGFQQTGHVMCWGVDVSDWAVKTARERGNQVGKSFGEFDLRGIQQTPPVMTALDVFEHMTDEDITKVIEVTKPKTLVVRIPSSIDGGKTFALEVSRQDPTHINCKTKDQWIEFFRKFGYNTFLRLNLYTVYDTPGVTCLLIL